MFEVNFYNEHLECKNNLSSISDDGVPITPASDSPSPFDSGNLYNFLKLV